jgi:hypothetical protein
MFYKKRDNAIESGFAFLLLFFVLALGAFGLMFFLFIYNKNTNIVSHTIPLNISTQTKTITETILPPINITPTDIPLPPDIHWEGPRFIAKDPEKVEYSLYLTNKKKDMYSKLYPLQGKLWIVEGDDFASHKELAPQYYDRILIPAGWTWGDKLVVNEDIELTPMMADGPESESSGYIFFKNGKGRQVIVTRSAVSADYLIKAPYQSVFVSDEFTLEDLLQY